VEPTFLIVGISRNSAPEAVSTRFHMDDDHRRLDLRKLVRREGIEQALLISTVERTDFVLWTRDASAASGSVLGLLTHEYGLTINDWTHFYRKIDEPALEYIFRLVAGFESSLLSSMEMVAEIETALRLAREAHSAAAVMGDMVEKAIEIAAKAAAAPITSIEITDEAKAYYSRLMVEQVAHTAR